MDQGFGVLISVIAIGASVVALFIALRALFGELIEDTHRIAEQAPGRAFLIGLVNFLFAYGLVALLGAWAGGSGLQFLEFLPLIILILFVIALLFGLAGMVDLVGARLFPERSGWRKVAGSAATLTLACFTPFVGWFGLFPYLGLRGLGAFILMLFARARTEEDSEAGEV